MGEATEAVRVLLVTAVFSRHAELMDQVVGQLVDRYGPIAARSPRWAFEHTPYYEAVMGAGLMKELIAFERLIDPATIVEVKLDTNGLEEAVAADGRFAEPRPVNIDPGYVAASKFVLATTKDYSHRLYLGRGIYAEVTLTYTSGRFQPCPWTYPDYREDAYRDFLQEARRGYLERVRPRQA